MSDQMERLATLAQQQLAAERQVADLEQQLVDAKLQLQVVSEQTLPSVMEELELEEFVTTDGLRIKITQQIFGNISQANRDRAFEWLRQHGHGGLIKNKVEASVDDTTELRQLLDLLGEHEVPARDVSTIHHQTLGKWVREMTAEGRQLPDSINVSTRTVSKITTK